MLRLLQELTGRRADEQPDIPALAAAGRALTRGELEAHTNQLARTLRDFGCRREDRVCVIGAPAGEAIVALLAASKADLIFVPLLDSGFDRLCEVIRSSEPACVLTTGAGAGMLDRLVEGRAVPAGSVIGALESRPVSGRRFSSSFSLLDVRSRSAGPVPSYSRPNSPACILFPCAPAAPGVVWTQASLVRFVAWVTEYFGIRTGDRHALAPSLSQDWSLCQMMSALAGGATLVQMPADTQSEARAMAAFVRRSQLTHWSSTFEELKSLADGDLVGPGDFASLRHVIWWGPETDRGVIRYWQTRVAHASFTTLFGVPETMMASAYYTVRSDSAIPDGQLPLPIGAACPGHEVVLLDSDGRPVGTGETGEVHVRGVGLSPGYWRNPEATRRAFWEQETGARDRSFAVGLMARRGVDGQIYPVAHTGQVS